MQAPRRAVRGNRLLAVAALVLVAGGAGLLVRAAHAAGPPGPPTAILGHLPDPTRPVTGTPSAAPPAMPYAPPTSIAIPAIGVQAQIIPVGQGPDGTLGTPPLDKAKLAGWYDLGPAPGQDGAAVIDAHVDSAEMSDYRGAFFTLGQAKPGMHIEVTRSDHTVAEFTIDQIQLAPKTAFPSRKVYTPTAYPSLRLITCGGAYDEKTHEYLADTIVYAHLTARHPG
jgi:sortase (surface protein transpeptidase)